MRVDTSKANTFETLVGSNLLLNVMKELGCEYVLAFSSFTGILIVSKSSCIEGTDDNVDWQQCFVVVLITLRVWAVLNKSSMSTLKKLANFTNVSQSGSRLELT
jgi:phosphomannomutase